MRQEAARDLLGGDYAGASVRIDKIFEMQTTARALDWALGQKP